MLPSALRTCIVLLLCLAVGGQWIALQSVAWASMLVKYSARAPLVQAIAETFDGQHPCGLCKGISTAQQSEKKPAQTSSSVVKHDLICALRPARFVPEFQEFSYGESAQFFGESAQSPPVPPPRISLS